MKDSVLYEKILQICREVNPDIPNDIDELLIDTGLIDSFGAFMILSSLEVEFDIDISPDDIKYDNFKSVHSIVDFLKSQIES